MCVFWQAGAETMKNVMFGEHPAAAGGRRTTKAGSGGTKNFSAFISIIGATCVISGEIYGGNG